MELDSLINFLTASKVHRTLLLAPVSKRSKTLSLKDIREGTWNAYVQAGQEASGWVPLSVGEAAAVFVESVNRLETKIYDVKVSREQIRLAVMMGLFLSQGLDPDVINRYRVTLANSVVHNDFIPIYGKDSSSQRGIEIAYQTIKKIFVESYNKHAGFDRLAYPSRSDGVEPAKPPLLEQFIAQVAGPGKYRWDKREYNVFPGSGLIISRGFENKMFPDGALKRQLYSEEKRGDSVPVYVAKKYRNSIVKAEDILQDPYTSIGLFRGVTVIRNPNYMQVDSKPFALIFFNDHFGSPLKLSYLIPDKYAISFLTDPETALRKGTPCNPEEIDTKFKNEVLTLCWESNIGGMNRAIPVAPPENMFYPACDFKNSKYKWYTMDLFGHERLKTHKNETRDSVGHMHLTHSVKDKPSWWSEGFPLANLEPHRKAHNEISACALTGFAIYDALINRAFPNYCYGYNYDSSDSNYTLSEPLRLLEQSIRWSLSEKEKNKPFLVPMTETGFDKSLVEEIGVIDTRLMVCYRRNRGSFMLPRELFDDNMASSSKAEAKEKWLRNFLIPAYHQIPRTSGHIAVTSSQKKRPPVHLVFMPGDQIGPVVKKILGVS